MRSDGQSAQVDEERRLLHLLVQPRPQTLFVQLLQPIRTFAVVLFPALWQSATECLALCCFRQVHSKMTGKPAKLLDTKTLLQSLKTTFCSPVPTVPKLDKSSGYSRRTGQHEEPDERRVGRLLAQVLRAQPRCTLSEVKREIRVSLLQLHKSAAALRDVFSNLVSFEIAKKHR